MAHRNIRAEVLEAAEDGYVSTEYLLNACINYLSTDDIKDMLQANDIELPTPLDDE